MTTPYYKPPIDPAVAAVNAEAKRKKEITVSSSSTLSLSNELAALREKFDRDKKNLGSTVRSAEVGNGKRRAGVLKNKGVAERNARDLNWKRQKDSRGEVDYVTSSLEKKAKQYDAIKRGDFRDVNTADSALDIDMISIHSSDAESLASGDEDKSNRLAPQDEEMVEYTDEFGRTRMVSRYLLPKLSEVDTEAHAAAKAQRPDNLIIGDVIQHEAFTADENEVNAVFQRLEEEKNRNLAVHYDASKEIRTKGVGFYDFSKDEEERAREMEELENMRFETEKMVQQSKQIHENWSRRRETRRELVKKAKLEKEGSRWLHQEFGRSLR
ncbi:uncharacterized protein V2V93DRAFT_225558 [Kockiozyma suomiensis]|uniref:uncharacterized protein n=1 Tax=Kockiozyma suomiensis TaxID=1337062 RepID=UPI0033432F04